MVPKCFRPPISILIGVPFDSSKQKQKQKSEFLFSRCLPKEMDQFAVFSAQFDVRLIWLCAVMTFGLKFLSGRMVCFVRVRPSPSGQRNVTGFSITCGHSRRVRILKIIKEVFDETLMVFYRADSR